jgi:hypothetical protein
MANGRSYANPGRETHGDAPLESGSDRPARRLLAMASDGPGRCRDHFSSSRSRMLRPVLNGGPGASSPGETGLGSGCSGPDRDSFGAQVVAWTQESSANARTEFEGSAAGGGAVSGSRLASGPSARHARGHRGKHDGDITHLRPPGRHLGEFSAAGTGPGADLSAQDWPEPYAEYRRPRAEQPGREDRSRMAELPEGEEGDPNPPTDQGGAIEVTT